MFDPPRLAVPSDSPADPFIGLGPDETIAARFRHVAAQRGDSPALVTERKTISYRELHDRACTLAEQLPGPTLPAAVVAHAALPRTATGKLDRRALPEPVWPAASGSATPRYEPPEPDSEKGTESALLQLARSVWQEVLGLETVGPDDDFLALGGDSVRAIQIANRLTSRLGVAISPDAILESPTLGELCVTIEALREA